MPWPAIALASRRSLSAVRIAGKILVVALVASACTSSSLPVASAKAADAPVRGGRVVVSLLSDVTSLDPLRVSDGAQFDTAGLVTSQIYDTLAIADRKTGEILPWLATWTTTDGRTYEFDIAANAVWSDGQPVVGQDFITAMKALARSKKGFGRAVVNRIEGFPDYFQGKASTISGLHAQGKHLTMRFEAVLCAALNVPLQTPPLPTQVFGRYLSDIDLTKNTDDAPEHLAPPVSSGPFLFTGWRHGEEIVLRANSRYWKGPPLVDEIAFRNIDRTTLRAAFQNGSLDIVFGTLRDLDVATWHQFDSEKSVRVIRFPTPGYTYVGWNTRSQTVPAFQDKRIRQALAYGLDVDQVVRQIVQGEGGPTRQHMTLTSWAYTEGLNDYPYDPAKAEALIQSAGYLKGTDGIYAKDGRPLAFTLVTNDNNPVRSPLVQFAADQYRAIGVRVTPKLEQFNSLVNRLTNGDPTIEAFVLGFVSSGDPNPAPVWFSKSQSAPGVPANGVGYVNPELDKAVDDGRLGPDCSLTARKRAYDAFNRILNEDQPYNFLFWQNSFVVTSSRVRGLVPGTYVPLPDAHLWWLAPQR